MCVKKKKKIWVGVEVWLVVITASLVYVHNFFFFFFSSRARSLHAIRFGETDIDTR